MADDWDTWHMNDAMHAASKSKDKRKKVGAVIIGLDKETISKGYNGPPRNIDDSNPLIHEQPLKDKIYVHAEVNAIYNASRRGASVMGSTLYVTFHPCSECAKAIIQSGIAEVVVMGSEDLRPDSRWSADNEVARSFLLRPAGVKLRYWTGPCRITNFTCDEPDK
jgi:dCMP deaminase